MKKYLPLLLLLLIVCPAFAVYTEAEKYLENRIDVDNCRYQTFLLALDLLKERSTKILVETGTARFGNSNFWGDGGSTIIFGEWAAENDAHLYSVDIDPNAIQNARNAIHRYRKNVHLFLDDSINFLKHFNRPIDFLYLDSLDFDLLDPMPSQEHHLREIEAAFPLLHDKSIVMIDDCGDLPEGGKGKLVIQFLLDHGWLIICNSYQVILVKN